MKKIFSIIPLLTLAMITFLAIDVQAAARKPASKAESQEVTLPPAGGLDTVTVEIDLVCGDWHRHCICDGEANCDCEGSEEDYTGNLSDCNWTVTTTVTD